MLLKNFATRENNFLLHQCRPILTPDPIIYLPMSTYDRSRIIRWKRGWLPSRPIPCTNCSVLGRTTRNHLITCHQLITKLGLHKSALLIPNIIDHLINQIPASPPKSADLKMEIFISLSHNWPIILQFMQDIDRQLHSESTFTHLPSLSIRHH